jgi:hypothetical protein
VASVLVAFPMTGAANLRKVAAHDLGAPATWLQRVAAACVLSALAAALGAAAARRRVRVRVASAPAPR